MPNLCATRCCGVGEIDGLSKHPTPRDAMKDLKWYFMSGTWPQIPFVTFTGVVQKSLEDDHGHSRSSRTDNYGEAFAVYLEANHLGRVVRSTPRLSWSKNVIAIWVWEVDYITLIPFLERL